MVMLHHLFKGILSAHPLSKGLTFLWHPIVKVFLGCNASPGLSVLPIPQSPLACASRMQVQEGSRVKGLTWELSPGVAIQSQSGRRRRKKLEKGRRSVRVKS